MEVAVKDLTDADLQDHQIGCEGPQGERVAQDVTPQIARQTLSDCKRYTQDAPSCIKPASQ